MKEPKKKKGVMYLFNDIIVVASRETKKITGRQKVKYQWTLPLSRVETSDSKIAYGQVSPSKGGPVHPIRLVVDHTGVNPDLLFHIRLIAPGSPGDPLLGNSTKDLSIENTPTSLSLAISLGTPDLRRKWMDKIAEEQRAVMGKDKARQEAIQKVHGKKKGCCIIL